MCRIKTGADITSENDLQNLITGAILRQQNAYRKSDILRLVKHYCRSSVFAKDPLLENRVQETIDAFARHQVVRCIDGVYLPQRPSLVLEMRR